jgi:5-carboxymethyl-2-hydroxymuconate isomerase
MPHFVIDCSENIIQLKSPNAIMKAVHDAAESTELFSKGDIKVRINPFKYYNVGNNTKDDFIHVFAHMMEGRNTAQKRDLAKKVISQLKEMFPDSPIISIDIKNFEAATYCNKSMV